MQTNTRFYVLIAIVLLALGGLWFVIRGGNSTPKPADTPKQTAKVSREEPIPQAELAPAETTKPIPTASPVGNSSGGNQSASTGPKGDGVITGTAKDSSGDPIAGATVRVLPISWKNYEARPADAALLETQTGNDGKFSISGLPLKMEIGIEAELGPLYALESIYIGEKTKKTEIELTLAQMAFIAGIVVNSDGEPVAGAALFAARWKEKAGDDDLPYTQTEMTRQVTDESGAFRFPHVPMGNFKFFAQTRDYAPFLSDWVVSGTDSAKFILQQGGTLTGNVVYSGTRKPASKVAVLAQTDIHREEQRQESAADGSFAFSNLRNTDIQIGIDNETLTLAKVPEKVKLAPGQTIDGIEIEIDKGGIVSGFVRDATTNKGVRNARLRLYTESRGGGAISTSKDATTDEDGLYTIVGLPSGSYTIYVSEAEGYVNEDYNKRQLISVTTGESVDDVNFTLDAGTSIAGNVVDDAGKPVREARVSVAMKRGGRWASAETDVNGLFNVLGVAAAPDLFVRAEKEGMVSKPVGPLDTSSAPVEDVTITMTKESTIAGTVVDESGKPVPRAQVIPYPVKKDRQGFGSPVERSDDKGEFKLTRLAEGEYQLQAVIGDGGWIHNPNKEIIRVAAGESKTGVRVVTTGAGGLTISGRVTGEDGKPVRSARVSSNGSNGFSEAQTDADGRYKLAGLKEGNFYIHAQAEGFSRGQLQNIAAGSENADIVLKGTGKIEGTVVDVASGSPVTDFEIQYGANAGAEMRNFQYMQPGARTRNDNGSFHIENAEAGSAALLVKAQGYAPKLQQVLDVVPGETKSGVVVQLEAGGIVTGRVLDGAGNPVSGAKIFDTAAPMEEYRRERATRTTSGTDGAFKLDGLPNGTVTISAYHPAHAAANVQVNVAPGKTTQADIVLGSGGTVRIRITENGQPATGAYAGLQQRAASDSMAKEPDANGVVEFTAVPEGDYRVYGGLRDPSGPGIPGRNQGKEITVTEGGTTEVALDFASGTASIVGSMAFNGQPPTRGWVQLTLVSNDSSGEETRHIEADANGQFRVENLPPGQARLRVQGMISETNTVSRQQTVDLVDGQAAEVTVELGGGGTVSGKVTGASSDVKIGVMLMRGTVTLPARSTEMELRQFYQQDLYVSGAVLDPASGTFSMTGIEPGQYTVCATSTDGAGTIRCATTPVNVAEGETANVSLSMP